MNTIHYIIVTVAFLLAGATNAAAQTDRNLIRQGNRAFKTQRWCSLAMPRSWSPTSSAAPRAIITWEW